MSKRIDKNKAALMKLDEGFALVTDLTPTPYIQIDESGVHFSTDKGAREALQRIGHLSGAMGCINNASANVAHLPTVDKPAYCLDKIGLKDLGKGKVIFNCENLGE